ncbi:hypothetical protein EVAR_6531_1 [Eumeta japonica]|uniref:Uncharacterized protein n=1 Tax=Eumeta variegata TaxID=151549 RepID=A0A4C1SQR5_EUMVA|nr:hypothetical protein EVAR_6531_1 [Eumeta japonica]
MYYTQHMDTSDHKGIASTWPSFWEGIGYLMAEKRADGEGERADRGVAGRWKGVPRTANKHVVCCLNNNNDRFGELVTACGAARPCAVSYTRRWIPVPLAGVSKGPLGVCQKRFHYIHTMNKVVVDNPARSLLVIARAKKSNLIITSSSSVASGALDIVRTGMTRSRSRVCDYGSASRHVERRGRLINERR